MPRTELRIKTKYDMNYVSNLADAILKAHKYSLKLLRGEQVWAKGDGVVLKQSCFSYRFENGELVVEGWLYDSITGESNLEGFVGIVLKKKMKSIMIEIKNAV